MPIETTSDFKKQLLLTRLHGVQASDADDREIDRKEKKKVFGQGSDTIGATI